MAIALNIRAIAFMDQVPVTTINSTTARTIGLTLTSPPDCAIEISSSRLGIKSNLVFTLFFLS